MFKPKKEWINQTNKNQYNVNHCWYFHEKKQRNCDCEQEIEIKETLKKNIPYPS